MPAYNHSSSEDVLLLTSALEPRGNIPFLAMKNRDERFHQTLCSLVSWITQTSLKRFVLCDNTQPSFSFERIKNLATEHGKTLEILTFRGDETGVVRYGKGYGEGEIISYAIQNSILLRDADSFYKTTGRIFVRNFNSLHQSAIGRPTVFSLPGTPWKNKIKKRLVAVPLLKGLWKKKGVHIVFFKCDKNLYRRHFENLYKQVNDHEGRWLEHVFYIPAMRYSDSFSAPIEIVGKRGTTGASYCGLDYAEGVHELALQLNPTAQGIA